MKNFSDTSFSLKIARMGKGKLTDLDLLYSTNSLTKVRYVDIL